MIIKGIILNKKGRRLQYIVLSAVTIACICVLYCFFILSKKTNISNVQEFIGNTKNQDIFEFISYYTEFKVTIKSNKTINNYVMKEWVDIDKYRLEVKNDNSENVEFIGNKNRFIIKNNGQKNQLLLDEFVLKRENYLSLSTFISLYNEKNKDLKYDVTREDNEIKYKIQKKQDDMKIELELIVNSKDGKPKQYLIYNNEELMADVEYMHFDFNPLIDEKLFAF